MAEFWQKDAVVPFQPASSGQWWTKDPVQQLPVPMAEQPGAPPPAVPMGEVVHAEDGDYLITGPNSVRKLSPAESAGRAAARDPSPGAQAANVAGAALRGVPLAGPFADRAVAGAAALTGGNYDDRLAYERSANATFDQDHPAESGVSQLAGGAAGYGAAYPLTKLSGLVGGVANAALGTGGQGIVGSTLRGGAAGAIQGAFQGAGESRDLGNAGDVIGNAAKGAGIGGLLGSTVAPIITGGGRLIDAAVNRGSDVVSSLGPKAKAYVDQFLSDPAVVAEARARMQSLGPQAMLADATPEWMGVARGAAAIPGSRNTVVSPLLARDAGKNARMQSVVDSELGPAPTPSWQEARITNNQRALGPYYDRVMEGQPPIDVNIGLLQKVDDELLHAKGDRAAALNKVRSALLMQNGQPDISARGVLESRRALDIAAENTTSGNEKRILGGYRQPIAQALDERSPRLAKVDNAYAELANQKEMLDKGQAIFNGDRASVVRPEELQGVMEANRPASNRMLSAGARAEIDRIIGTKSNDVQALNTLLQGEGDWNRTKLRMLFGQDKADRVLSVLDAEQAMQATKNRVTGGSDTAMTAEFKDFLKQAGKPIEVDPKTTFFGGLANLGSKAVNKIQGDRLAQRQAEFANQMAKLSVSDAQGAPAVLDAITRRGQRQNTQRAVANYAGAAGGAAYGAGTAADRIRKALVGSD